MPPPSTATTDISREKSNQEHFERNAAAYLAETENPTGIRYKIVNLSGGKFRESPSASPQERLQ